MGFGAKIGNELDTLYTVTATRVPTFLNLNLNSSFQGLVVAGLLLQLGLAHRHAGHQEEAQEMLERAGDIYKIVPGVEHPFYKDDFHPLL